MPSRKNNMYKNKSKKNNVRKNIKSKKNGGKGKVKYTKRNYKNFTRKQNINRRRYSRKNNNLVGGGPIGNFFSNMKSNIPSGQSIASALSGNIQSNASNRRYKPANTTQPSTQSPISKDAQTLMKIHDSIIESITKIRDKVGISTPVTFKSAFTSAVKAKYSQKVTIYDNRVSEFNKLVSEFTNFLMTKNQANLSRKIQHINRENKNCKGLVRKEGVCKVVDLYDVENIYNNVTALATANSEYANNYIYYISEYDEKYIEKDETNIFSTYFNIDENEGVVAKEVVDITNANITNPTIAKILKRIETKFGKKYTELTKSINIESICNEIITRGNPPLSEETIHDELIDYFTILFLIKNDGNIKSPPNFLDTSFRAMKAIDQNKDYKHIVYKLKTQSYLVNNGYIKLGFLGIPELSKDGTKITLTFNETTTRPIPTPPMIIKYDTNNNNECLTLKILKIPEGDNCYMCGLDYIDTNHFKEDLQSKPIADSYDIFHFKNENENSTKQIFYYYADQTKETKDNVYYINENRNNLIKEIEYIKNNGKLSDSTTCGSSEYDSFEKSNLGKIKSKSIIHTYNNNNPTNSRKSIFSNVKYYFENAIITLVDHNDYNSDVEYNLRFFTSTTSPGVVDSSSIKITPNDITNILKSHGNFTFSKFISKEINDLRLDNGVINVNTSSDARSVSILSNSVSSDASSDASSVSSNDSNNSVHGNVSLKPEEYNTLSGPTLEQNASAEESGWI